MSETRGKDNFEIGTVEWWRLRGGMMRRRLGGPQPLEEDRRNEKVAVAYENVAGIIDQNAHLRALLKEARERVHDLWAEYGTEDDRELLARIDAELEE